MGGRLISWARKGHQIFMHEYGHPDGSARWVQQASPSAPSPPWVHHTLGAQKKKGRRARRLMGLSPLRGCMIGSTHLLSQELTGRLCWLFPLPWDGCEC
jgi:hypothetical protein